MSSEEFNPNDEKFHSLENFNQLHSSQFDNMKLPAFLRKITHKKLYAPKFITDEELFDIAPSDTAGFKVTAKTNLRRWADVWIVPHIVTGTADELYKQIKEDKDLCERLWVMMDLDRCIDTEENTKEQQQEAKKEAEVPIPAGAKPTIKYEADAVMVEVVMAEADVSRERAIAALENTGNDLVAAITECNLHPDFVAAHDAMNKRLFVQCGDLSNVEDKVHEKDVAKAVEAEAAPAKKAPETEEEKYIQRVNTVYKALFQLQYVGMYMTMRPRGPDSPFTGPPHPEEIIKTYYVPHELGACVGFSDAPNVKLASFVCITTGNMGWSLLWADKDLKAGDVLTRAVPNKIPCPYNL